MLSNIPKLYDATNKFNSEDLLFCDVWCVQIPHVLQLSIKLNSRNLVSNQITYNPSYVQIVTLFSYNVDKNSDQCPGLVKEVTGLVLVSHY